MFGAEACTRLPWNISTEPGLPVGATMPPSLTSRVPSPGRASTADRTSSPGRVRPGSTPCLWLLRHQHQRPVDRHDLVHEHGDVHRPRLRHAVVARPGAVILVPLPDIALEGGLGVDLVLVHVELFAEHLLDRTDQAGMIAEQAKRLVVGVGGERGARRPGLLAPHLLAVGRVDLLGLVAQDCDFLLREAAGQEQPAFLMRTAGAAVP